MRKLKKYILPKRRYEILAIDIGILVMVYFATVLLMMLQIGSMQVEGRFTFAKLVLFAVCVFVTRIEVGVYRNIWRYDKVNVYIHLVAADAIGGMLFYVMGRLVTSLRLGFAVSVVMTMGLVIVTLLSRFIYHKHMLIMELWTTISSNTIYIRLMWQLLVLEMLMPDLRMSCYVI